MSERQSGRRAPWPERDPRETATADQRPEEAPAEVTRDEDSAPEEGAEDSARTGRDPDLPHR